MKKWKKFLPLLVILALMAFLYFSGYYRIFNYETLRYHHAEMVEFAQTKPILAPVLFILIYLFATALSIPGAVFLSILGGLIFPLPWCTLYVILGATIGASLLFLAAKTALGPLLRAHAGERLKKMEAGFKENAASYLLFLRFVPLFPFWIINIAPAFFNVRLWTYIWTTFVGIIPGAFVYTQAGRGLNSIFETADDFSISSIFTTQMRIALVLLALFALIPILIKKLRRKNRDRQ